MANVDYPYYAQPSTALGQQVAVIGAGYAGLAAAVTLAEARFSVTVFEASRTLGGRARRVSIDSRTLDNGQHILVGLLGRSQHVHPTHVGHLDVRDEHVDAFALENLDRRASALGERDVVPLSLENDGQELAHRAFIVDDENTRLALSGHTRSGLEGVRRGHTVTAVLAGSVTATVVPAPGCERT